MYHIKRELYGLDFLWPGPALGILVGQSFVGRADRASNVQNFSDGFIVTNSIYVACDV